MSRNPDNAVTQQAFRIIDEDARHQETPRDSSL